MQASASLHIGVDRCRLLAFLDAETACERGFTSSFCLARSRSGHPDQSGVDRTSYNAPKCETGARLTVVGSPTRDNGAAMSLCLASLLTNSLRSECLVRRQNPAFWRRGTQGLCRKRNQAARVKCHRDCPKQVHLHWKFAPARPAIRGLQPHIVGRREARLRRSIESGPTPDRVAVRGLREECRKKKR